jgi:tRNA(Ile)-lysidine synthase
VELCGRLGIELHRVHFDTNTYADLHHVSIEMAARELRYRWFEQLRQDIGAAAVCVAHHQNDSVETILMNIIRGTGLRGLTGIQARNGYVLRPLLCVSRDEIERFLSERGQSYVTDSSNLTEDYMRNKIRLQVLPLLQTLNPAVLNHILQTAENLAAAQATIDVLLKGIGGSKSLNLSEYTDYLSREYVTFEWLRNYGFNGSQVHQLLASDTGAIFTSPMGYEVLRDRNRLLVEPVLEPMKPLKIPEEGVYVLPQMAVSNHPDSKIRVKRTNVTVSKDSAITTLDSQKVQFPLTVRRVAEGDRMVPFGMKGRKLLSDLMTDQRMTLFEKRRQLVVVDAHDEVIWAVGLRTDQRVAVTSDTAETLELRLEMK